MKLRELLELVKDRNLTKEKVEEYRDELIHLNTAILIERSELKKKEALYFLDHKEESAVRNKMEWRATSDGFRLLELEAYKSALPKEIDSLKSRIYSLL